MGPPGGQLGPPGAHVGPLGVLLGVPGALLGASGEPLGPSKTLQNRSRRLSRRPPAPELDFGSILGVILAPFWDPLELKKQGFRVEGVAFFEKSRGSSKIVEIGAFFFGGGRLHFPDFQNVGGRWVGAGGRRRE